MMKTWIATALLSVAAVMPIATASATDRPGERCHNCVAPRPSYDSQEVVRSTRDVDRSRVINTQSVVEVPSSRPVRTRNHLLVREHTTRNVGVVRHNHTIIEKEIRYRRKPVVYYRPRPITINYVTQQYRTVHRPALVPHTRPVYSYPRYRPVYPRYKPYGVVRVRG